MMRRTGAWTGGTRLKQLFHQAKVLNHIQGKQRAYVGDLKLNRKVVYTGREQKLQRWRGRFRGRPKNPCGWAVRGIGTSANRCGFPT